MCNSCIQQDFAIPGLMDGQPSRFATMLFYLNDGMVGGETSFPRWLNAKTSKGLKVKPKAGKAILFYNVLPDGNYDERSQHAAEIVIKGEKWLTNLWVWVSNNGNSDDCCKLRGMFDSYKSSHIRSWRCSRTPSWISVVKHQRP